jgi:DNA-binding transcriptional MerR regulator
MAKSPDAFRTISEVSEWLNTPAHVLRFWESKFSQIRPVKRAGGRRYYRPEDMALLGGIKALLHEQGMTIKGVQKLLREQGIRHVAALGPQPLDLPPAGAELRDSGGPDLAAPVRNDAAVTRAAVVKATKPMTSDTTGPAVPTEATAASTGILTLLVSADAARLRGRRTKLGLLATRLLTLRDRMAQTAS